MPIASWQLQKLQDRYNQLNKQKLVTQQDANAGVDPNSPANSLNPKNSPYLSSDYDATPNGSDENDNQTDKISSIQSISGLSDAANQATATAAQFQSQEAALKQAARQGAISRRSGELSGMIDSLKALAPYVNISSKIDPGTFSKSSQFIPGTNITLDQLFGVFGSGGGKTGSSDGGGQGPSGTTGNRAKVLKAAQSQLGVMYQWGAGGGLSRGHHGPSRGDTSHGTNRIGFDCSGLTDYAYSKLGWHIGIFTGEQAPWAKRHGKVVPKSKLVPGDIVFGGGSPSNTGGIHHVAIYWGNGKIIEAPQTWVNGKPGRVRIAPMRAGQWGVHLNY